ncbi:twin-arginine translocase TatA/TatE family subunit [Marinimicrobium agarilyticum]|uniref:twin-arginine translocase TatA/TatE family subunit n=1 Tax=Marinimicrobium agarilyticum TaxID=306546 RepID=UPI00040C2739|nr:twin-arginine translocase TatA/TatE family subunit [Marinimicrobium agarilyticum]
MGLSVWQIALVAVLFLLLFGRGKIPQLMGDLADGIKSFKKGVADDGDDKEEPASGHLKQSDAEQDKAPR